MEDQALIGRRVDEQVAAPRDECFQRRFVFGDEFGCRFGSVITAFDPDEFDLRREEAARGFVGLDRSGLLLFPVLR